MKEKVKAQARWDFLLKTALDRPLTDEECEEMHTFHRLYNAPMWDTTPLTAETIH
jgi:hypothetical protein